MKIVFMGTPLFSVASLFELRNANLDVELVITQIDKPKGRGKKLQFTPIKEKAIELGIEVFQPLDVNSVECIEKLKAIKPDLIVVVAYGQILSSKILQLPKYGCINVHASLLPRYRGAAPINWAIINGELETGVTIMEMERGLDTGDMLINSSIPINIDDDYISIHDKLSVLGAKLLIQAIDQILKGNVIKTPQQNNLSNYAPMIYKEAGKIDWNKSGIEIINLIRGLKPWPSGYSHYKNQTIKIHKARIEDNNDNGKIGEIIKVSDNGIYIKCVDKLVVIEEIQFPNKKKMYVKEYLAGNDIEIGEVLI